MQLIFDSLTGNVRRFTQQIHGRLTHLTMTELARGTPRGDFLLLTYTFGTGEIPESTKVFLNKHSHFLQGVVASGSYHWGKNFALAADLIAEQYNVPIVAKINKVGQCTDLEKVVQWLNAWEEQNGFLDRAE